MFLNLNLSDFKGFVRTPFVTGFPDEWQDDMDSVVTVPVFGGTEQAFRGDDMEEAMERIATGP